MTEPTPPLPLQPKPSSPMLQFLKDYQPFIERIILIILTAYFGAKVVNIADKTQVIEQKADTAAVRADVAADKAAKVEDVTIKNQAVSAKTLANVTGAPEDVKAAKDAKAQLESHIAATQEGK